VTDIKRVQPKRGRRSEVDKQNITVKLDGQTLRKAKGLAAYEQAERRALSLLEGGFRLGGTIESTRDEWHER
jgi:hypothetical protein